MNNAFTRFKALADRKKNVYDEDLLALVAEPGARARGPLRAALPERDLVEHGGAARARCACASTARSAPSTASGDGMVDACFKAIAPIVGRSPQLERYPVKAITGGTDAQGEVSCSIRDDEQFTVTGQGVHTDIIMASALAYVNALNKLEYRHRHQQRVQREGP